MADIEHKITIDNNLIEVYKAVTAYEEDGALKAWQPNLKSVGVTAGNPLRTGSMIGMTRKFVMGDIFVNADVIDMQRNKRFELQGIHGRFRFQREIEFTPNGRETVVTDRIWLKTGWLFFWWKPIALSTLRSQTAKEWQNLKAMLDK
ncbi:MAG: hypothetical protein Phog2KO_32540 [Phototrophicaceae bacterium]